MLFSWYIVCYLFLAGAGSGAFLLAACCCMVDALRRTPGTEQALRAAQSGFYVAPALMVLAVIMLLLDVGNPERIGAIAFMPLQSVMSAGAWMVAALTAISSIMAGVSLFCRTVPRLLLWACCIVGSLSAVGVMTYTGLLLSDMASIDFWHTPLLTVLFVASSLSTGMAAVLGVDVFRLTSSVRVPRSLWRLAAVLGCAELAVLAAFFAVQSAFTEVSRQSCALLLTGDLAPTFWLGVVGAGVALPFAAHAATKRAVSATPVLVGSAGTLAGGLLLRYCVVAAALFTPMVPTGGVIM